MPYVIIYASSVLYVLCVQIDPLLQVLILFRTTLAILSQSPMVNLVTLAVMVIPCQKL
jgi:hypothetical protein